jgi:hypothetical protein
MRLFKSVSLKHINTSSSMVWLSFKKISFLQRSHKWQKKNVSIHNLAIPPNVTKIALKTMEMQEVRQSGKEAI